LLPKNPYKTFKKQRKYEFRSNIILEFEEIVSLLSRQSVRYF
jgi:hypothetical protein